MLGKGHPFLRAIFFLLLIVVNSTDGMAQIEEDLFTLYTKEDLRGPSGFRIFLSKFSFSLTSGYDRTYYKHKLDGYNIVQRDGQPLMLTPSVTSNVGDSALVFMNWLNAPTQTGIRIESTDLVVSSDSIKQGYRGSGGGVPLQLVLHYNIKKFRIGIGGALEMHGIKKLKPLSDNELMREYESNATWALFKRYFLMLGYEVHEFKEYTFVGDIHVGKLKHGKKFENIGNGIYVNIGGSIERNISEYLRGVIRPSIDIKSYKIELPGVAEPIKHRQLGLYLNLGFSYSFPPLKRCPIKTCHSQIDHQHSGNEFRSRRHKIYKKQHPNYGENDPTLLKYKGKNKNKLNPN